MFESSHQTNRAGIVTITLLALTFACRPYMAQATPITLTHGMSSAVVDPNSSIGMSSWDVGSGNQLLSQWFFFRVGGGLAQPINAISAANILYNDANTLVTEYANAQFSLRVTYSLQGTGIGTGLIKETISVTNLSGLNLDFHLFQYSDFNLLGGGSDSVLISGSGPGYDSVIQWQGANAIQEGIITPPADRGEVDLAYNTLNNLNGVAGYNLGDSGTSSTGPITGDVTWSFQWDRDIGAGGGLDIFKDKTLSVEPIPEPSVLALIAASLVTLVGAGRRRN